MILLDKTIEHNGAATKYHRVADMRLTNDGIQAIVNSYHRPEMVNISWQDTYLLPPPFSAENYEQVEQLLVHPGAPFEGGSFVPEVIATVEEAQARRWGEVKALRTNLEQSGTATTPSGVVQCDDKSKLNISGLVQMATIAQQLGAPFEEEFTLADNTEVTVNAQEMIALGIAVGEYISAIYARARVLRLEIFAEDQTIEEVMAIDITEGWPT